MLNVCMYVLIYDELILLISVHVIVFNNVGYLYSPSKTCSFRVNEFFFDLEKITIINIKRTIKTKITNLIIFRIDEVFIFNDLGV